MPERVAEETKLLSKSEVLERVGVTFPTLWNWCRAGKFPSALNLNGLPRWNAQEVEAFLVSLPKKKYRPARHDDDEASTVRVKQKAKKGGGRNA